MNRIAIALGVALLILAAPIRAVSAAEPDLATLLAPDLITQMEDADVVFLGEVHDNPAHHLVQADALRRIAPRAVVWEMMPQSVAAQVTGLVIDDPERLEQVTGWTDSGWPPLDIYLPVFQAARGAMQFGALVPRSDMGQVIGGGIVPYFGVDAGLYGLKDPLPEAEQAAREADQQAAHCNAMPEDKLWMLVDIQRLRDAVLARAVRRALGETGGPVAVITGNGHARLDRGAPVYLRQVDPALKVFAPGQSEESQSEGQSGESQSEGQFDAMIDSPAVDRPDPCAVFTKS